MSQAKCQICHNQQPAFLCFCREVQVCQSCISSHLLDDPAVGHKPVLLNLQNLTQALQAAKEDKEGPVSPQSSKHSRSEKCALLRREMERLTSFQSDVLLSLQALRMRLEHQVAIGIEEVCLRLTSQTEAILVRLRQAENEEDRDILGGQNSNSSDFAEVLSLTFEAKEIDLAAVIKSSVRAQAELIGRAAESRFLYKVFGGSNSIGVFDVSAEQQVNPLVASVQFFHNSCSCESPDHHIFITGGSLTGRSRNEVYRYSPAWNSVQQQASMQMARRSHCSLFIGKCMYVFGGLLEEDRLSLCERYHADTDCWEQIAHMKERRAYLSCCEYRRYVYIAGGCDRPSIEKYDIEKNSFTLIPMMHAAVQDSCSLLVRADLIWLFHGSFRGEVTTWDPATDRFAKKAEMCVGNSWSSCAPIVVDRTVYLLRADSVFKYDLDSGTSEYVLRMTRSKRPAVGL